MNPVETYFDELNDIHRSGAGVKETSYYGPLATLFNEIGKSLKPKVKCVINLSQQGAGIPDGGFYTADQLQKVTDEKIIAGLPPARGAIEIKSAGEAIDRTINSEQVRRYLQRFRLILVTNYREFVLVIPDEKGNPVKLESYRIAENEKQFWVALANPRSAAHLHSERLTEYVKRVMLHAARW